MSFKRRFYKGNTEAINQYLIDISGLYVAKSADEFSILPSLSLILVCNIRQPFIK